MRSYEHSPFILCPRTFEGIKPFKSRRRGSVCPAIVFEKCALKTFAR